jgi:P27 family predicted phage terminase small subunit
MPPPPAELTDEGLEEWRRVAPVLFAAGLLTDLDVGPLMAYCTAYGRWRVSEAALAREGLTITTPRGSTIAHPLLRIAQRAMSDVVRFGQEFGLSPASRNRVRVESERADPTDSFFPAS